MTSFLAGAAVAFSLLAGGVAAQSSNVAPAGGAPEVQAPVPEVGSGRGGVGGGPGFDNQLTFYVGVPNVEAALRAAESHGGTRVLDPQLKPGGGLVVAHFRDPEGNLVGLAGPR